MNKYVVILGACCCLSNVVLAEEQGIEDTNYRLSASVSAFDSGNNRSLSGEARFPIANYIGASITGRYLDFDGKNEYIDSSTSSVDLGIFLRKYDLGVININYDYSRLEADLSVENADFDIKTLSLGGTYYFKELDVGFKRLKTEPDSGSSFNVFSANMAYYVNDNFSIGASILKMDADGSSVFASYQPELFGDKMSIFASYQDSDTDDILTISLSYYFDTKVSLKDRARRY